MDNGKSTKGFKSKFGFLMASAGSAIGLGNLWSFPYKAGEGGGGAFVIVFIIMMALVGLITLMGEFYIGKRAKSNVVDAFGRVGKNYRWLGIFVILTPFIILCYYQVIGGWSIKYAVDYIGGIGVGASGAEISNAFSSFISGSYMPLIYLAIFIFIVAIIVLGGVKKGIERASKIMMPLLFIFLIIIVIKSLTLPGASKGLEYLFKPDFSKLNGTIVLSALGQVFFSLSLGMGINIAYGCYMKKSMQIGKSSAVICALDFMMAMLAGIAIFPAVFSYGLQPSAGPGLLFESLAYVFANMGGGRVFGAIFFLLVTLAAITSSIALLEVLVQCLCDKFKCPRKITTITTMLLALAIGCVVSLSFGFKALQIGGMSLLDIFDTATTKIMLPLGALVTALLIGWKITPKTVMEEMEIYIGKTKFMYNIWGVLIKFITPLAISIIFILGLINLLSGADGISVVAQYASIGLALFLLIVSVILNLILNRVENKNFLNQNHINA